METEVGPEQPSDMSRLPRSPVPFSVCRALSLSVRHSPSIRHLPRVGSTSLSFVGSVSPPYGRSRMSGENEVNERREARG